MIRPSSSKVVRFGDVEYRLEEYFTGDFSNLQNVRQVYGLVLSPDKSSVLVVSKDGKEWTLPGGKPEAGESYAETLEREVYEESAVGIDAAICQPVFFMLSKVKKAGRWELESTSLRFLTIAKKVNNFTSDPAGDIKHSKFVPIEDLDAWLRWGAASRYMIETAKNNGAKSSVEDGYWLDAKVVEMFFDSKVSSSVVETVNKYLNIEKGSALDLGCGGGRNSEFLHELGLEVFGCDKYSTMIEATKKKLSAKLGKEYLNEHFCVASMDSLPYADNKFDLVLSSGVLHNAESEDEFMQALVQINRVLKSKGLFYLNIFYYSEFSAKEYENLKDNVFKTKDGFKMVLYNKAKLLDKLTEANFNILEIVSATHESLDVGKRDAIRIMLGKE